MRGILVAVFAITLFSTANTLEIHDNSPAEKDVGNAQIPFKCSNPADPVCSKFCHLITEGSPGHFRKYWEPSELAQKIQQRLFKVQDLLAALNAKTPFVTSSLLEQTKKAFPGLAIQKIAQPDVVHSSGTFHDSNSQTSPTDEYTIKVPVTIDGKEIVFQYSMSSRTEPEVYQFTSALDAIYVRENAEDRLLCDNKQTVLITDESLQGGGIADSRPVDDEAFMWGDLRKLPPCWGDNNGMLSGKTLSNETDYLAAASNHPNSPNSYSRIYTFEQTHMKIPAGIGLGLGTFDTTDSTWLCSRNGLQYWVQKGINPIDGQPIYISHPVKPVGGKLVVFKSIDTETAANLCKNFYIQFNSLPSEEQVRALPENAKVAYRDCIDGIFDMMPTPVL